MDITSKIYPSKVLLFGEYTVIDGGDSIAIPYYKRYANWDYDLLEFESRKSLMELVEFVEKETSVSFDNSVFKAAWDQGLYLDSNIPQGYGTGSSGSLVAAFYDAFVVNKHDDLLDIQKDFQKMEALFHGASSGIDPLVAYYGQGIWKRNGNIEIFQTKEMQILDRLYLWDSRQSRTTAPLVEWYKKAIQSGQIPLEVIDRLKVLNSEIIKALMENDHSSFESCFVQISTIEMEYFTAMFPEDIRRDIDLMQATIPNIQIKLCGAGGGGFYLCYLPESTVEHDKIRLLPLS